MSRNGLGIYSLPATYNPVVTNTPISIAWANTTLTDIQTAITNSIASNGETVITANLPMATYKHTNVGNASARTDYAAAGQIQDGSLIWCGTATGTANALILTASPVITAVTAGMTLRFKAGASPNSGATTVTIGGAAAIAVQNNGVACAGGEIAANNWYEITVDASLTSCQLKKIGQPTYAELGLISGAQGGTGVVNTGKTITLGGNISTAGALTTVGAFASTFTMTGVTSVTFPTSGTLVAAGSITTSSLTQNTARLLGRTTAASGAVEEISVGAGLTLSAGALTTTAVPALVLLATLTPTAVAAVNSLNSFSSTYDAYLIVGEGIAPASNDNLLCRLATGGSLDSGSNYYRQTSFSNAVVTTTSSSSLISSAAQVGASSKGINFILQIINANDSSSNIKSVIAQSAYESTTANNYRQDYVSAHYIAANTISGIGFLWNGGSNFNAQGKIRIYGITNS